MPWDVATTVTTFAISSASVHTLPFNIIRASAKVLAAVTAQVQTISLTPKTQKGRKLLWLFMLYPPFLLIQTDVVERGKQIWSEKVGSQKPAQHPIEALIEKSTAEYSAMLERQSKTLEAATEEYRNRYRREPPPGFDQWFAYAKKVKAPIIDEYDLINEMLEPFWNVDPSVIKKYIQEVADNDDGSLHKFRVVNGNYDTTYDDDYMGNQIKNYLHDVIKHVPDVEFIINGLDEPRVILPSDLEEKGRNGETGELEFHDLGSRATWNVTTENCRAGSSSWPLTTHSTKGSINTFGLPFVQDIKADKQICQHPEYEDMHGLFISPASFYYTAQPVPILSQCAPSTFGDILYPSAYYFDRYDDGAYDDESDPAWEQKRRTLYWAGSSTGSNAVNSTPAHTTWQHSHRQRFVSLANGLLNSTVATFLTETAPGLWKPFQSREILRELYDAKFTSFPQCDEEECVAEEAFFHLYEHEDAERAYQSRFIFDLDGNSFSGRYYTLLGSRSVVLKQTILREWHDERLYPWVHYVPVSLAMDELPETMRYLALTERGSRRAKTIAETGRRWKGQSLRREDAGVWMFRLVLEYARVLDEGRDGTRLE